MKELRLRLEFAGEGVLRLLSMYVVMKDYKVRRSSPSVPGYSKSICCGSTELACSLMRSILEGWKEGLSNTATSSPYSRALAKD